MKKNILFLSLIIVCIFLVTPSIQAQAPQLLNYQGKLVKDGIPATGTNAITFSIYSDSTGSDALWIEARDVIVKNGVFNVLLGSVMSFPNTLFTNGGDRYLGIKVGTDPEMRPRFRLTSVAYAIRASKADIAEVAKSAGYAEPKGTAGGDLSGSYPDPVIKNDSITSSKIKDKAVSTDDIADNSVTSSKIKDKAVSTADIADNSVTSNKILNGEVKNEDIAKGTIAIDKLNFTPMLGQDLHVFHGSIGGNDDIPPIDTGISISTYPNAIAIFRGSEQYDSNRSIWVIEEQIRGKWHVDINGDVNGDGGSTIVYFSLLYW